VITFQVPNIYPMFRYIIRVLALAIVFDVCSVLALAAPANPLATLRAAHPRLLVLDEDVKRANDLATSDKQAQAIYTAMKSEGEKVLTQTPVAYVLKGPRLLDKSRTALDRITLLAGLYRLDHDRRWADRATREMLAVSAFGDWHPDHFLDTAEMTAAVAIGYDWLYDALSPADRATIRQAIVDKGLTPGLASYQKKTSWGWFPRVSHNWNLVCNGGMVLGALAVAEDEPDLSSNIVTEALQSMPKALATYAPDGGWPEGPSYWEYATKYTVFAMAGLQTALGTDFTLSDSPGFSQTGFYRIYMNGPVGKSFNFSDAGDRSGAFPESLWLAKRFGQPVFAWSALHGGSTHSPLALFWFMPGAVTPAEAHLPPNAIFHNVNAVMLRSGWNEPGATYVGFKGGDNGANHSHLDLGSFVLDALGVRWVEFLGSDDYDLPGYFGKERFTYYRLGTSGQNTLVIGDANQNLKAKAPITNFQTTPQPFTSADLTAAYSPAASRVERSVQLIGRGAGVMVQDTIEAPSPISVRWQVHTRAAVTLNGRRATLLLKGKTLYAQILQPADAVFSTESAEQSPPQNPNKGVAKLVIDLGANVTSTQIDVLLSTDPDLTAHAKCYNALTCTARLPSDRWTLLTSTR